MHYLKLDFQPTEEQITEIEAQVVLGTMLGDPGVCYLTYDNEVYSQPAWLVGEHVNVPGEPLTCPSCGVVWGEDA